jgi:uncharacterized repeat protein (TIGR03803 family)
MPRKQSFRIISEVLAITAVMLVLVEGAWAGSKYKVLYTFGSLPDGQNPNPGLVLDSAGNLYGATYLGGDSQGVDCGGPGCGTIFKLAPNADGSWTESIVYDFSGTGSAFPGGLIFDPSGNLYGTTQVGPADGEGGTGSVFEFNPNPDGSWTYNLLFAFVTLINGTYPNYALVFDSAGNLYGSTLEGGQYDCGVIFQLSPNADGSWTQTVLYAFTCGADGSWPVGALVLDKKGNLYGATGFGGIGNCNGRGCGTIFSLTKNSDGTWAYHALYSFTGEADGGNPAAGLSFYGGNLYGSTQFGGDPTCNCGVLFALARNSAGGWSEQVFHTFTTGKDGMYPETALKFDAAGNLYYVSESLAAGDFGAILELVLRPKLHLSLLHRFVGQTAGSAPNDIVFDGAGNIYGTTYQGGLLNCGLNHEGCGVVFKITP